jgi:hypothetical protein
MKGIVLLASLLSVAALSAQQNPAGGGSAAPRPSPRQAAPIDITGNWVSYVTEDWRFRMITPPKGDYTRVPLSVDGRKAADAWNPTADTAAGNQCRTYGVGGIMRVPGHFRITWQDDSTIRIESDAGMQTRMLHFSAAAVPLRERTWQGYSVAQWDMGAKSLRVNTTRFRAGYLRRNGVPYSEDAVINEYFDVAPLPDGNRLLVIQTIVDDPKFLQRPFIVSTHFKQEKDGSKWNPQPCVATW